MAALSPPATIPKGLEVDGYISSLASGQKQVSISRELQPAGEANDFDVETGLSVVS